jgi:hypothetical protein
MAATNAQRNTESTRTQTAVRAGHAQAEANWVAARARLDLTHDAPARAGAEREHRIRALAYAIAQQHGFTPGRELQDWLEAERRVDAELGRAASRSSGG